MLLSIKKVFFVIVAAMFFIQLLLGGCIFDDKESGNDPGWTKITVPSYLKGTWYRSGYVEYTITATKMDVSSREWVIAEIASKDDTLRAIGRSNSEYKAFYFTDFSGNTASSAKGITGTTLYEAKVFTLEEWFTIEKR